MRRNPGNTCGRDAEGGGKEEDGRRLYWILGEDGEGERWMREIERERNEGRVGECESEKEE